MADSKPGLPSRFLRYRPAAGLLALAWGASLAAALLMRFKPFWNAPRLLRAPLLAAAALVLAACAYPLVRGALNRLRTLPRKTLLAGALTAIAAGLLASALLTPSLAARPVSHTLTVTVPPAGTDKAVVEILEVRDTNGLIIQPADFQTQGKWKTTPNNTLLTRGGQAASLSYKYSAPAITSLAVMLRKQPDGSRVVLNLDNRESAWDLASPAPDITLVQLRVFSLLPYLYGLADALAAGLAVFFLFVAAAPLEINPQRLRLAWGNVLPSIQHGYNYIIAGVFVLLLLLPWIDAPLTSPDFSRRFWGREPLLRAYAAFRLDVLGDRLFNETIVTNKTWLVYTGEQSLDDYQNTIPFKPEELETIQQKLDKWDALLKAKGIQFLVVVPPNKNTVYPEYMPPQIAKLGKTSRLQQIIDYEKNHGTVKVMDLTPALLDARKDHQIYFSTDTHWNAIGALAAYQAMFKRLAPDFPALVPHALSDYTITRIPGWSGDINNNLGQLSVKETYFKLDPKFDPQVTSQSYTSPLVNKMVVTERPDPSLPRLVMYHDSFGLELIPFLSSHFSHAVFQMNLNINAPMIDQEKPDIVIVECTERYLWMLLKFNEP